MGTNNNAVTWSVNGVSGGNVSTGTIDTNGVYTAPPDLPSSAGVTITAASQADSTKSNSATATITSDVVVSASTAPASTIAIPLGATIGVTASIASQGHPDQTISWSVNGIANGNSTVGTLSPTGNGATYQAPASLPTPYTVTLTAKSVADTSKSASIPLVIAGTIASATQTISASSGGTITLPDGSSVTIASGVLAVDESVSLSEVSYLPNQPPNTAFTSVSAGMILAFGAPVQFDATIARGHGLVQESRKSSSSGISTSPVAIQFSVNATNSNSALLNGSAPTANFVDAAGNSMFIGVDGNVDSTMDVVSGNVRSDLLSSFANDIISAIQFAAINLTRPPKFLTGGGLRLQNSQWISNGNACPTGKTLVVVHGMLSSVESAFPPDTAKAIQMAGGSTNFYQEVVGFDYDWLQSIRASGSTLAGFLDMLAACGVDIDVEAHSEGVPVSMTALTLTQSQTNTRIKHFVTLGGPIMGTQAANDTRLLQAAVLAASDFDLFGVVDLATILDSPFVDDLRSSAVGDGGVLDQVRSQLVPRLKNNSLQMIVAGGTAQRFVFGNLQIPMSAICFLMGTANCDGIIPLTSALAFDSQLTVFPLPPFAVGHTELVSDQLSVLPDPKVLIGRQVTENRTPSLLCEAGLSCEASRTSPFQFTGTAFDPTLSNITILSQDSSGAVVQLSAPGLQNSSGSISWSSPSCWEQSGPHSIFVFDSKLASNNVAQKVDSAGCSLGAIATVAGTGTPGYAGDNGPALSALLSNPTGIAFDPLGNMYIADAGNNVVRKVDASTQKISTIAGTGVAGFSGDKGPAINAQLNEPTHVVFDSSGNLLYITDVNNERVRRVNTITGIITTIAGTGIAGFAGDDGPATAAQLDFPDGVGLDGAGNLYIGDALNNRVRRVDSTTGFITTVAGTGTAGFSGDGDLATNAELRLPSRPSVDTAGNIYIADSGNNRVRRVDATTHVIVTVAGSGTPGFSGDGGPSANAQLNDPLTVTVDSIGNLYIGEINNERIRLVNTRTSAISVAGLTIQPGTILTIAGNGIAGYQGDGGPATSAELNFPTGILLSPSGNLYLADAMNNVIRVIGLE